MTITTFVLAALAQATPQSALQPGAMAADARCLAVFSAMVSVADAKSREAGQLAAIFFGGKMLGRDPQVDLTARLTAATLELVSVVEPEIKRCTAEFQQFGQTLITTGTAMQAQGRAMKAQPPK